MRIKFNRYVPPASLRILAWNANGLRSKKKELEELLRREHIDIALINETHFNGSDRMGIANYVVYNNNRDGRGGGTAIYVRKHLPHHRVVTPPLTSLEASIVCTHTTRGDINLVAAYRQPRKNLHHNDLHSVMEMNNTPTILAGDLNSKNTGWDCRTTNVNGRLLQSYIDRTATQIRAPSTPTFFGAIGEPDILDIALVRGVDLTEDPVVLNELSSDHNPLLLQIGPDVPNIEEYTTRRTDWNGYQRRVAELLPDVGRDITGTDDLEEVAVSFGACITRALNDTTTTIRRTAGQYYIIPTRIRAIIKQRRQQKKKYQRTLDPGEKRLLNRLNNMVKEELRDFHNERWREKLDSLEVQDNSLFRMAKALTRKKTTIPPLNGRNGTAYCMEEKLEAFADTMEAQFREKPHVRL